MKSVTQIPSLKKQYGPLAKINRSMDLKEKPLVNRVAQSSLVTINLEDYFPTQQIKSFDLKDYLFQGLILREKDFRKEIEIHDWAANKGIHLAVHCSSDAIIPTWAYMLVATSAQPYAQSVFWGTKEQLVQDLYRRQLAQFNYASYQDQRIVIKGCSGKPVPPSAYTELAAGLRPYAQSIMYGEPCSTVPIYKRKRKLK